MDISALLTILSAVVSAVGAGAVAAWLSSLIMKRGKEREPTLEGRISELTNSLQSASSTITEIEGEISQRKNLVQQLEKDVERYNILKELNQAQVEAIAQTLKVPLVKESRKSLIMNGGITFFVALVFFAIGYFVGGR